MTSNCASDEIAEYDAELRRKNQRLLDHGTMSEETIAVTRSFKEQAIKPILKAHFKCDRFLGRIDEILYFLPSSKSELRQLVLYTAKYFVTRFLKPNFSPQNLTERFLSLKVDINWPKNFKNGLLEITQFLSSGHGSRRGQPARHPNNKYVAPYTQFLVLKLRSRLYIIESRCDYM